MYEEAVHHIATERGLWYYQRPRSQATNGDTANEAYGLTNTGAPVLVFSTKQPDTGQESDEYSYVHFQTKS